MTGEEIKNEIFSIRKKRTKKVKELMKEYDVVMQESIKSLQEMCPHEEGEWEHNGLGWDYTDCKWCGYRLRSTYWHD